MLQKVTAIAYLILILWNMQLFCMRELGVRQRNSQITVFENGKDELIYIIDRQTISGSLNEVFQDFNRLIKVGKFSKAKNWLEDYCNDLNDNFRLQNAEMHYFLSDLKELQQVFESQSKQLLKNLDSNFNVIKVGFNEAMKLMGLLATVTTGATGLLTIDSGIILMAFIVGALAYYKPVIFFAISMIFASMTAFYEPYLIFNVVFLISFSCVICLMKMDNKRTEKNIQIAAIKKLILNFKKRLKEQIRSHPHNDILKQNYH